MKRKKEQLEDKITSIVKGQFVKDIVDWSLQGMSEGKFQLEFTINQEKLGKIEKKLGFRILMTDRHDWSTVDIIKTYYGQSMIEHAFKEEMSDVEELIVKILGIKDIHYNRLKFRGVGVYN